MLNPVQGEWWGLLLRQFREVRQFSLGSAVCYSNSAKKSILSVNKATLNHFGAVSSQCAAEMAEGAVRVFGTDLAVSVTGIAGPEGGSPENP